MTRSNSKKWLSGKALIGDDFTIEELEDWYNDEKEGYFNLVQESHRSYEYIYHELNALHGFSQLKGLKFGKALGFGSAWGDEFLPIIDQIEEITILEPSEKFQGRELIGNTPCRYVVPNISGALPFPDETFDLITSLGVLHHIPNVSFVLKECGRCMRSGGYMLVREPISSMGDWSQKRKGLTKRERGIPVDYLVNACAQAGFQVQYRSLCQFSLLSRLKKILKLKGITSNRYVKIDRLLSRVFAFNRCYHRRFWWHKIAAGSVYVVLRKT